MIKIIMLLFVTLVSFFVMGKMDPTKGIDPLPPTTQGDGSGSTNDKGESSFKCTITGEVTNPGDYEVYPSTKLSELISSAGGLTDEADTKSINQTITLEQRKSIYIPSKVKLPDNCIEENAKKVNINRASYEDLLDIGFKSNQAKSLISYRQQNGDFKCIEDIQDVTGIGDSTYIKLRDLLTIM